MSLNKYKLIAIAICLCSLLCACSTDGIFVKEIREANYEKNIRQIEKEYDKSMRKKKRKNAKAEKLDAYQLRSELQSVDYELDSLERLQHSVTDTFIVEKIYDGRGVYEIILVSIKNNKHYEIYSPREKFKNKEIIKVGQSYIMTIVPYFNDFYGGGSRPVEIVRFVYFKDFRIIPVPIHFGQVYSTENLKGLCYVFD